MKHQIEAVAFCLGWLVSMLCVYFAGKNIGRCERSERELELIRGDYSGLDTRAQMIEFLMSAIGKQAFSSDEYRKQLESMSLEALEKAIEFLESNFTYYPKYKGPRRQ